MYLDSERIYLREVRFDDLTQDYCDWLNDPEVNRYLETRFEIQTVDRIRAYWEAHREERWFAICLPDKNPYFDGKHIGNIKLAPISWIHRRGEVSLVLKKKYWKQGYGSEAIKVISDYAFSVLNLHKLTAGIYRPNAGSIRAFEKAGFHVEGNLLRHVFSNGVYEHVTLMARFNES